MRNDVQTAEHLIFLVGLGREVGFSDVLEPVGEKFGKPRHIGADWAVASLVSQVRPVLPCLLVGRAPDVLAVPGAIRPGTPDVAAPAVTSLVQGALAVPALAQSPASFVLRATYSSTYSGRMRLLPPSLMERICPDKIKCLVLVRL